MPAYPGLEFPKHLYWKCNEFSKDRDNEKLRDEILGVYAVLVRVRNTNLCFFAYQMVWSVLNTPDDFRVKAGQFWAWWQGVELGLHVGRS